MGNKFTFVLLFLFGIIFNINTIIAQTTMPGVIVTKSSSCKSRDGIWQETSSTKECVIGDQHCLYGSSDYMDCLDKAEQTFLKKQCELKFGQWNPEDAPQCCMDEVEQHKCDYSKDLGGQGGQWDSQSRTCKLPETKSSVAAKESAPAVGSDCIQNIRTQIIACKNQTAQALLSCQQKDDKNSKIQSDIGSIMGVASQVANAGALLNCQNLSYATAAASYGLNSIQANCNTEMNACHTKCSEVTQYSDPQNIINYCKKNNGTIDEAFITEANNLAGVVESAKQDCLEPNNRAEQAANQIKNALAQSMNANQSAAACQKALCPGNQAISADNPLCVVPAVTDVCLQNPSAPGCPVNCGAHPNDPKCICLTNSKDPSCNGGKGPAAMANANLNAGVQYAPLGNIGSGLKTLGPAGGSNLGDLNIGEASAENPLNKQKKEDADANAFGVAAQASSGHGGGGGGSSGGPSAKDKNIKPEEEKGIIGGTFQVMKNMASSLFGGGSSGSRNKPTSKSLSADNGIKPMLKNSSLRGLASNGQSCFIDAKGAEFCFGSKNKDIFKMMNLQYTNQANSLINDK